MSSFEMNSNYKADYDQMGNLITISIRYKINAKIACEHEVTTVSADLNDQVIFELMFLCFK